MSSDEIRKKFLDFFQSKNHTMIPSASLIPENDPTLLFTNSGMFPLVPFLLGEKHPGGKRLANSQKCFRTEDIDEVGDNRHNTFFEMLGNWSLGDYFKKEQLEWWFKFMVNDLEIDPKKIYQTVYGGDKSIGIEKDNESIKILREIYLKYGIEANEGPEIKGSGKDGSGMEVDFSQYRIFAYKDKNWWKRGDAVGELGGPDSETFYDTGKKHNKKFGKYCHVNCDCGRFLEIGNSVFMQYQKTETGWKELVNKNVDFGGGLERLTMVSQGKDNIFETDLFQEIINEIENLSGRKYREHTSAFEIIADHLKAAVFIIGDEKGITPSNIGQGYVVRRLIRRAIRYAKIIGVDANFTKKIAEEIIGIYKNVYSEIESNKEKIFHELELEEERFKKTLEAGMKEFEKIMKSGKISGKMAFLLFSTFGFPIEMVQELAKEKGIRVNIKEFESELEKHKDLSRTASAGMFKGGLADTGEQTTKYHTATHLLLAALREVLSGDIIQKGSNITVERLRFDFNYLQKFTDEQIKKIEDLVNEKIQEKISVEMIEMPKEEALKEVKISFDASKYGNIVKVYKIGDFSIELCGGPHVKNTGELGIFKIIKEESSSAGVRRIKAVLN